MGFDAADGLLRQAEAVEKLVAEQRARASKSRVAAASLASEWARFAKARQRAEQRRWVLCSSIAHCLSDLSRQRRARAECFFRIKQIDDVEDAVAWTAHRKQKQDLMITSAQEKMQAIFEAGIKWEKRHDFELSQTNAEISEAMLTRQNLLELKRQAARLKKQNSTHREQNQTLQKDEQLGVVKIQELRRQVEQLQWDISSHPQYDIKGMEARKKIIILKTAETRHKIDELQRQLKTYRKNSPNGAAKTNLDSYSEVGAVENCGNIEDSFDWNALMAHAASIVQ